MKVCPNCNAQLDDNAAFCINCGASMNFSSQPNQNNNQNYNNKNFNGYQNNYTSVPDPYDHTAEYDAKDISNNKVIAMGVYLLGFMGIIIALLASGSSPYVAFHVRQSLKFTVAGVLLGICAILLCWTIIVPIAAGIMYIILWVLEIICFFQVCSGKAKEPAIIRNLGFFR